MNKQQDYLNHKIEQENKLYNNSQNTINTISKQIDKTYLELEEKIINFTKRFTNLETQSKIKAYRGITEKDLYTLKDQIEELTKFQNIPTHILKHLSNKLKIIKNKSQQLDLQIDILLLTLANKKVEETEELLLNTYNETANDDFLGLLGLAILVDRNSIRQPKGVDNKSFDQKIWENLIKMSSNFKRDVKTLVNNNATEENVKNAIDTYKKRDKRSTRIAIEYENRAIAEQGAYEYATKTGATHFKIVAVLDKHTTEICRSRHNKVYSIEEYEIGNTVPPLHYNCRSIAYYLYDYEGM